MELSSQAGFIKFPFFCPIHSVPCKKNLLTLFIDKKIVFCFCSLNLFYFGLEIPKKFLGPVLALGLWITRHPRERQRVFELSDFGAEFAFIGPSNWASFDTGVSAASDKSRVTSFGVTSHTKVNADFFFQRIFGVAILQIRIRTCLIRFCFVTTWSFISKPFTWARKTASAATGPKKFLKPNFQKKIYLM